MGLEIVFASAAKGTQGTLVAFQARVDDHVSLPVALAFDDQSTHRTLERLPAVLRGALMAQENIVSAYRNQSAGLKSGYLSTPFPKIHLLYMPF